MILGMLLFSQISASCAAGDAPATLASVAKVESGFNTLAIHDNTTGETHTPAGLEEAITLASQLISSGESVDLGLMQIDSANLSRLGLSVRDAFDPCKSISAGSRILREGYQHALRIAFSRYNTGNDQRGFANGYVGRVEIAANSLPEVAASRSPTSAAAAPSPSRTQAPAVVVDMLHAEEAAASSPMSDNLLAGVNPEQKLPLVNSSDQREENQRFVRSGTSLASASAGHVGVE